MRSRVSLVAALLWLTSSSAAAAADPPDLTDGAASDTPATKPAGADKVYLDGGEVITGTVIEQTPGKQVIVRMANGEENRIDWAIVSKVVLAKKGATTPAPRKATKKPVKACAEGDDTCEEVATGGAGVKGAGVGVHGERVVHLKAPGTSATMMAIDGGFLYGTSTKSSESFNIYGGGANLNVTFRGGGTFPGEDGGTWHGVGVDIYGGVFGAGVVAGNTGAGLLLVNVGGAVGYQLFSFGTMNEETFKQHGFGLFLAGRAGVSNSHVFAKAGSSGDTNAQYGPQITISFPEYNFGTSSRSAFYISGFVMPTGDFLFANIQLGGAFSL